MGRLFDKLRAVDEAKVAARAEAKGRAAVIEKQLAWRFGTLPRPVVARLRAASIEDLDRGAVRVLEARSLDDVFR